MFGPTHEVTSSNIKTLAYDQESQTVRVEFKNKKTGETSAVWDYRPMTQQGFNDWLEADSIGHYFQAHVKGVLAGTKVSG